MRIDRATILVLLCALGPLLPAGAGRAQPRPIAVTLSPPARLAVGDRAEVVAEVAVQPGAPVLVTPASEGAAVEVVRGRLLRADADDAAAATLRFRIPIVAREPGAAVMRVHVQTYTCRPAARTRRCRATEGTASVVLRVQSAG